MDVLPVHPGVDEDPLTVVGFNQVRGHRELFPDPLVVARRQDPPFVAREAPEVEQVKFHKCTQARGDPSAAE
jgi:hypothetical protein